MNKLFSYFIFIISMIVLFMAGGHLMDVGDILGDAGYSATNGFFSVHPHKIYHIGYYLMYLTFFIMVVYNVYFTIKLKYGDENGNR